MSNIKALPQLRKSRRKSMPLPPQLPSGAPPGTTFAGYENRGGQLPDMGYNPGQRRSTIVGGVGRQGSSNMPEYQNMKSKARTLFDKYDTDGSGCISIIEFRKLCYDMGYFLTDKELELDVQILDVDGDGEINYEECKH